ncbi:uncharacterized protein LOC131071587 [Cryptomeria japonica]|uniref:uncharacterized protein LOC131071587 n=1 Tax=Cryptomeria japonica TaxID=3369 RepID=UPI0027DA0737|nr:uncharacterized protein LOC131071587 [Cryptomeria japonica]
MDSNTSFKVILGSSSSSRQSILREMGFDFTIISADIDEKAIRKEKPEELVMVLAEAKAEAIMSKLATFNNGELNAEPSLLITADQASKDDPQSRRINYLAHSHQRRSSQIKDDLLQPSIIKEGLLQSNIIKDDLLHLSSSPAFEGRHHQIEHQPSV